MFDRLIGFALKRPALAVTIGVSVVLSLALLIHGAVANTFATDFSVYWRTANEPAEWAYQPRTSLPFPYPPTMMLWISPLAFLPMWVAFAIWVSLSVAATVAVCRNYLQRPALALLLVCPPMVNGLATGQVSATLAALLLWSCGTRNRFVAGLALAVIASIKPQFVIMAPLLLLVSRDARALLGSVVGFLAIVGTSVLVFGQKAWIEWYHSMSNFHAVLDKDNVLGVAITPAAAAEHVHFPPIPFLIAGSLIGIWLVIRCRKLGPMETSAAIATGSLLAAPYALTYDLVAIAPLLVAAAFADRKVPVIALAGVLNPLPLLLTSKLLSDQARGSSGSPNQSPTRQLDQPIGNPAA